jgi:arylsulfatase
MTASSQWQRLLVVALALGSGACPAPKGPRGSTSPAPRRPPAGSGWNVLLLTIDTLRADHLGLYGYRRATSPNIDRLGRRAMVFEQAYTFWPKTRGSFAMLLTGRTPSQNGYSKKHPMVLGFNPTLASVLQAAGYATTGVVDNPNVAAQYGYAKGFSSYRETWLEPAQLPTEMDRTRAITADGLRLLKSASRERPFFLWLHYVNPHGPYQPPAPFDQRFMDEAAGKGPRLKVVDGFHGGVRREWARGSDKTLGYYVALYDGEIAAVDAELGRVLAALDETGFGSNTLVVLTSDHGESLGEHGYFFDHGEDLFDPGLRIPLLIAAPGGKAGRSSELASTLDLMPTILDAAKLPYPPGLAGQSLMPVVEGRVGQERPQLHAGNERNLAATFDRRFKLVASPTATGRSFALYDREQDPDETSEAGKRQGETLRVLRREQELFLERADREWAQTRVQVGDAPGETKPTGDACEALKALGYVDRCP